MSEVIDFNLLRNCSKKFNYDELVDDVLEKYKITNIIDDDETYVYICNALAEDYRHKRANYKAYIRSGIDARLLMDLRRNALLRWGKGVDKKFLRALTDCKTWNDSRVVRTKWIRHYCNDQYRDFDWQYHYLLLSIYPPERYDRYSKGIEFNFEYCFEDCDANKCASFEDYENDFIFAHFGFSEQWRDSPVQFSGRSIMEDFPDIELTVEVDKRMFWVDLHLDEVDWNGVRRKEV